MKTAIKTLFIVASAIVSLTSCDKNEEAPLCDKGYCLSYIHVPAETLHVSESLYAAYMAAPAFANLHVWVTSALTGYSTPQYYYLDGEKEIELQISNFLDPEGDKYTGVMPIAVCYTTDECKSIKIKMMDKDNNFIEDITDEALFYNIYAISDINYNIANIVINADHQLVGRIETGTNIEEYLSLHPMVFTEAHFIFPNLKKDIFSDGTHAIVEIELSNGTICSNEVVVK